MNVSRFNEILILSSYFVLYKNVADFPLTKLSSLEVLFDAIVFSETIEKYLDYAGLQFFAKGMKIE